MRSKLAPRTVVLADVVDGVDASEARVIRTPLDLVLALDEPVDRVVLVGRFARDRGFATFVRETDPSIVLIVRSKRTKNARSRKAVLA